MAMERPSIWGGVDYIYDCEKPRKIKQPASRSKGIICNVLSRSAYI